MLHSSKSNKKYTIDYQFLNKEQSSNFSPYLTPWDKEQRYSFKQIHGPNIKVIQPSPKIISEELEEFDGGIVFYKGAIIIRTADCVPVLLFNQKEGWVAALHCGWRSVQQGIIQNFFSTFNKINQSTNQKIAPEKMKILIGPAICEKCYLVREDLIHAFSELLEKNNLKKEMFFTKAKQKNQYYFNLKKLIIKLLINNKILENNIKVQLACTYEHFNLNSHRLDQTKERNISFIGIR